MAKIIKLQELKEEISALKNKRRSIVLVGGCFDIVHIGHIKFLKEAKRKGDVLFVLLESDQKVKNLKGNKKPFFEQLDRATVLSSIQYVDYVLIIPAFNTDEDYSHLVRSINPNIIALTAGDPLIDKKKKQAEMVGGKIVTIPKIRTLSSSQLANSLGID